MRPILSATTGRRRLLTAAAVLAAVAGLAAWGVTGPLNLAEAQQTAIPAREASPARHAGHVAASAAAPASPAPAGNHQGHRAAPQGAYVPADPPVTGVTPATGRPPDKAHREFQANCTFSHRRPDDPIVYFNQPGRSHSHDFMGNTTTNAKSTMSSLRAGGTSCRAPEDLTGYWMPTLYNGDKAVQPVGPQTIYYKSGIIDYPKVRAFPTGLRFVVGSPKATAREFTSAPGFVRGWECGDSYGNADFPRSCPAGSRLNLRMQAQSCWDGRYLDTPDHQSHMAYPIEGRCPVSHPVAVPMIEFKMAWPVSGDLSRVRLASGAGPTFHYDVYNMWAPATLDALVKHCINAGRQCDARGYSQFEPDAGAALDENYLLPGSRTALDRTGWTATASRSGGGDVPARMLDGDTGTRWTTGAPMTAGQSITVDMRSVRTVSAVSLRTTGADHPRGYRVFLSPDGRSWSGPVAGGTGLAEQTMINFGARKARFIKVEQTGTADSWWSVAEFQAYAS